MKTVLRLALLAFLSVCTPQVHAQQKLLLQTVGAASGQALYATHMAVNTLGDAWVAKAYNDTTALQMAGGYEGGMKAMTDYINQLLENGTGLSAEDQTFLSGMVDSCQLVTAQISALKGFIKTGDRTKADIFESKRKEAQNKIFTLLGISKPDGGGGDAGGTKRLTFQIIQSTSPNGKNGQLGKVEFVRPSEGKVFTANWTYDNGNTDQGIGIPFPGSGVIAVGFGPDVLGVAIYKRSGTQVSAQWAPYLPGSDIGTYEMTQGNSESEFNVAGGGGKIIIEPGKNRTAAVTWQLATGTFTGVAVASGDYLAAISVKPGGKAGVAIYTADIPSNTASGRWIIAGGAGVGEELYKLTGASGGDAGPGSGGAASSNPEQEVKDIAEALLVKGPRELEKLRPDEDQIYALTANDDDGEKLEDYVDEIYGSLGSVERIAKPGQTEIHVFSGDALPGGYTQQAAHLKPGLKVYGFEYVVPGEQHGMSYDGLVKLNGKWVMIPKMWRAFTK